MALPTMNASTYMGMDFENVVRNTSDNYDEVRGWTTTPNKQSSRASSMSSTVSSVIYHERMEMNNDNDGDAIMEPINMPQLSYVTPRGQDNQVSMVADSNNNTMNQRVSIEGPALNSSSTSSPPHVDDDNVINIQLLYDPNRPTEPELWDSNFHPVLLHGSLEHLTSDAKNIKKSMGRMAIYIKNKKIETSKSNDIKDFEGIGRPAWELISSIYEARWDSLIADNHKNTFRQKVSHKFTPWVNLEKHGKKQDIPTNKPTSIERLPPPIPAKSPKEVNEISKYFKTSKPSSTALNQAKSYAQSAKYVSNTKTVLKIKVAFSSLKAANINNIQKITKGNNNSKSKLYINMITKELLHKQVIVPMSNINQKNLMKKSGAHIANLNRALKNIKSDITVDFICSDTSGIIIAINKVANSSDLQTIKHYVKDTNHINSNKVNSPRLSQSKSYLKIISLPYLQEDLANLLNSKMVKKIIKNNHIFNNIMLVLKPYVIKISPKLDMVIIWIDI